MIARLMMYLAITFAAVPLSIAAQNFPGRVEEALVGDWDCDGTRTYITKHGSVELIADGYRAGLFDAAEGVFAIRWDEGGREDWVFEVDADTIVFTYPDGLTTSCTLND